MPIKHFSTLCYIQKDGAYLMLHRTVKEHDVNKDKWIGVGGHFEEGESPEECVLREVKEETGYTLTSYRFRGLVTFLSGDGVTEYMSLFTADGFTGEPVPCDEGELEWVPIERIQDLNIWEGDKIFLKRCRYSKSNLSASILALTIPSIICSYSASVVLGFLPLRACSHALSFTVFLRSCNSK